LVLDSTTSENVSLESNHCHPQWNITVSDVKLLTPHSCLSHFAVDNCVHNVVDELDEAPIQSGQIPANVAPACPAHPACLHPRKDDSFSDIDRSKPMSTFIRSLADQTEAMLEQEQNKDNNENGTSSVKTMNMPI
jgi:hypothetical protein